MPTAFGIPLTPEDEAIFDRAMKRSATMQRLVGREADELNDGQLFWLFAMEKAETDHAVIPRPERMLAYSWIGLRTQPE